ncbi:MAG: hypothetical protein R2724_23600 [Bryobacterales bacterium]
MPDAVVLPIMSALLAGPPSRARPSLGAPFSPRQSSGTMTGDAPSRFCPIRRYRAALTAASYNRVFGANERVSLGFVGPGNRGDQVLDAFLEHGDSEINALCDIRLDYVDYHYERTATRGKTHALPGLPQAARAEGPRRRRRLHARPLARLDDHTRLPSRQGRLRREAATHGG